MLPHWEGEGEAGEGGETWGRGQAERLKREGGERGREGGREGRRKGEGGRERGKEKGGGRESGREGGGSEGGRERGKEKGGERESGREEGGREGALSFWGLVAKCRNTLSQCKISIWIPPTNCLHHSQTSPKHDVMLAGGVTLTTTDLRLCWSALRPPLKKQFNGR